MIDKLKITIKDKDTDEPIEGVDVFLESSIGTRKIGDRTNTKGNIYLLNFESGEYRLSLHKVKNTERYEDVTRKLVDIDSSEVVFTLKKNK